MKYVVFTAKHHAGFCMFDTKTTPFSVMNTPWGKDLTGPILKAFRDQGIAPASTSRPMTSTTCIAPGARWRGRRTRA